MPLEQGRRMLVAFDPMGPTQGLPLVTAADLIASAASSHAHPRASTVAAAAAVPRPDAGRAKGFPGSSGCLRPLLSAS
jgi:hypothetical protein